MTWVLQTAIGGLSTGAVYALVAMGFSIVYRTMGLVNFAHADVVMIGAYVTVTFFLGARLPFGLSLLAAILVTGALGVAMERVLRPLESRDLNLMLIGTIGFGIVLESVAILIWGSFGTAVPTPIPNLPLRVGGLVVTTYQLLILAVAAVVTALLFWFLDRTKLGTAMQAVAMDRIAATAMGVDVAASNALAFAIGSGMAAVAGALVGPLLYVSPGMGASIGIKGFAAAILGGFGSIPGAIVGGLVFGLIEAFSSGPLSAYSDLITFVVFALAMSVRQTGIFGERTVDRA
ncbi:MAG TPA: branched-chain amino acid ABC transporter permease [Candidatus Dormibacteraeota bacterium]|jgi:branched-chain amino acid transport system permease protein|nr:branched-chain amino acid ABC transporter permease [Candidatus Dormibacteraeota bacterium]